MLFLTLLSGLALAGDPEVTLNGVDVGMLRDRTFRAVDVYIDKDGNIRLTSDRYEVHVEDGVSGGALAPPAPVRPSRLPPTPSAAPDRPLSGSTAAEAPPQPAARPTRVAPQVPASTARDVAQGSTQAVASGAWWLATEDNASRGHEVRVYINGTLVKTVASGQAQVIEDISSYLHPGANDVLVMSRSLNPGGGGFYVYVGQGLNEGGSVTLAQPDIQHGLGPSRKGDDVRQYTLVVP